MNSNTSWIVARYHPDTPSLMRQPTLHFLQNQYDSIMNHQSHRYEVRWNEQQYNRSRPARRHRQIVRRRISCLRLSAPISLYIETKTKTKRTEMPFQCIDSLARVSPVFYRHNKWLQLPTAFLVKWCNRIQTEYGIRLVYSLHLL